MTSEALLALGELADILERLELTYVVGGSLASGAWGEPRSTHDVDLLVSLQPERVAELSEALTGRYYFDRGAIEAALHSARTFNVIHLGNYQKLDLFVAGSGPLDTAQLERRVRRALFGPGEREFPVTSPELVVLRKLDWYRMGEMASERQWRDVLAVLRVQGARLDFAAMRELAETTDLTRLLLRACTEALGSERPDEQG